MSTKLYRKKSLQPMRPYIPGEGLEGISVNAEDTPEIGGMIAHNLANPADQWYVGKKFFEDNYEEATMPVVSPDFNGATPTVGRIVHYVSYGTPGGEFEPECRAAIVTEVTDPDSSMVVGLCVMNPTGNFFNRGVPFSPSKAAGTWHWPERV